MDSNEINNAFNSLRSNIQHADEGLKLMLPCLAGRLKLCGAGTRWNNTAEALSQLKRELRNWDISKRKWK